MPIVLPAKRTVILARVGAAAGARPNVIDLNLISRTAPLASRIYELARGPGMSDDGVAFGPPRCEVALRRDSILMPQQRIVLFQVVVRKPLDHVGPARMRQRMRHQLFRALEFVFSFMVRRQRIAISVRYKFIRFTWTVFRKRLNDRLGGPFASELRDELSLDLG